MPLTQEGWPRSADPCTPGSRLGTTRAQWMPPRRSALIPTCCLPAGWLTSTPLCKEQDSDALRPPARAGSKFSDLPRMSGLNLWGHHITHWITTCWLESASPGHGKGVQVYLEPGEAWALNVAHHHGAGTPLPEQQGHINLAILDMSAACHTPDVIVRCPPPPPAGRLGEPGEKPCTFHLPAGRAPPACWEPWWAILAFLAAPSPR